MLSILWVALAAAAGIGVWIWRSRRAPEPKAAPGLRIAGTAIRFSDLGIIALPLPKSHDDIRELVERTYGSRAGKHQGEVGYITSRGGFVRGHEALVIARQARQLRQVPLRGDVLELDYLRNRGKPKAEVERVVEPLPSPATRGRVAVAAWMNRSIPSGQIATREDLYRELVRTATFTVPCLLIAGLISVQFGVDRFSGFVLGTLDNGKVAAPIWAVASAQCAMYVLLGLGLALVLHARGSDLRPVAVATASALVVVSLLWAFSFDMHGHLLSLVLVAMMVVLAPITVFLFGSIRTHAALLTVPALAWTALATYSTLAAYVGR